MYPVSSRSKELKNCEYSINKSVKQLERVFDRKPQSTNNEMLIHFASKF